MSEKSIGLSLIAFDRNCQENLALVSILLVTQTRQTGYDFNLRANRNFNENYNVARLYKIGIIIILMFMGTNTVKYTKKMFTKIKTKKSKIFIPLANCFQPEKFVN